MAAAAASPSPLENRLSRAQVERAVRALFAFVEREQERRSAAEGKSQLFEEEHPLYVQMQLMREPDRTRAKPRLLPLAHSLFGRDGKEVCLIVKDPQRHFKDLLEEHPVANVTRVIGISKLRAKFGQYKDKRELLSSYDLFLADDRVVPLLPALLGKSFFKKKRQPIPVSVSRASAFARNVARARDSTQVVLTGSCVSVLVGDSALAVDEVVDNVMAAVPALVHGAPRRWRNVQGLFLKTHESVALPLYEAAPVPVEEAAAAAREEAEAKAQRKAKRKQRNEEEKDEQASKKKKNKEEGPAKKKSKKDAEPKEEEGGKDEKKKKKRKKK